MSNISNYLREIRQEKEQEIAATKRHLYQVGVRDAPDLYSLPMDSYQFFYIWIPQRNYVEPCLYLKNVATRTLYAHAARRLHELQLTPTHVHLLNYDGTVIQNRTGSTITVDDGVHILVKT